VIPERYGEMRKGNLCGETGRSMGDTERFWGDTGKSGGDTERFVGGLGNIEKVYGDAGIFGGTPGEDLGDWEVEEDPEWETMGGKECQ
jgi:hypothetical protein